MCIDPAVAVLSINSDVFLFFSCLRVWCLCGAGASVFLQLLEFVQNELGEDGRVLVFCGRKST